MFGGLNRGFGFYLSWGMGRWWFLLNRWWGEDDDWLGFDFRGERGGSGSQGASDLLLQILGGDLVEGT